MNFGVGGEKQAAVAIYDLGVAHDRQRRVSAKEGRHSSRMEP